MDAALEVMLALRQAAGVEMASLKNARARDGNISETAGTFRHDLFSRGIQARHESAAKLLYFGESVRFAALINNTEDAALFKAQTIGLEIPVRIRSAGSGLGKQIV